MSKLDDFIKDLKPLVDEHGEEEIRRILNVLAEVARVGREGKLNAGYVS